MDLIGKILAGKYKIIREIGRGGMAVVYEGIHLVLDKKVAVKVLHARLGVEDSFRKRLIHEAKSAAKLEHPNIVQVYDAEMTEEYDYIVMEYVDGEDLKTVIEKEGPLPVDRIWKITSQIASALECAHAHGIVHRDIKPQNVLIAGGDKVKVADFGIARAAGAARLTMTGMAIGTPEYMSPEQAEGEKELDKRSDIYSLGIVMYEMLTGKVPFEAKTPMATLVKQIQEKPKPIREIKSDIPEPAARLVHKCLEKDAERRYQDTDSLIRDLKLVSEGKMTTPKLRMDRTISVESVPKKKEKEEKPAAETISKPPSVKKGIGVPAKAAIGIIGMAIILGMFFYLPGIMRRSSPARDEAAEAMGLGVEIAEEIPVEEEIVEEVIVEEEEVIEEEPEELELGGIEITSNPSNAEVYIDYKHSGTTPKTVSQLKPGKYKVKVKKKNYEEWEKHIDVKSEQTTNVYAKLEPRNGFINFSLNPRDSKVYIDGKYKSDANKYVINLKPGKYSITVKKEHHSDWKKTVEIKPGTGEYLTIILKPKVTGPPFVQPERMNSYKFLARQDVALDLGTRWNRGWDGGSKGSFRRLSNMTSYTARIKDMNNAEDAALITYVADANFTNGVMEQCYWPLLVVRQSDRTWKAVASHRMLTESRLRRYGLNPENAWKQ